MKKTYLQPKSDASSLYLEALICTSGDGENLVVDPAVDPWGTSSTLFDNSIL